MEFAELKPSVVSFILVTLMAIVGIALAKWVVSQFPVPEPLRELVLSI